MMSIRQHLIQRLIITDDPGIFIDEENRVATFFLYNLSGKIVGYQQYRPDADKKKKNDPKEGRYYTYITDEGESAPKKAKKHIALYGVDTINRVNFSFRKGKPLFIVEGIFDAAALHYHGYPAVAVLQNDPKNLKSFFAALNVPTIALCDGDEAGNKLAKIADTSYTLPKDRDVASLNEEDSNRFMTLMCMIMDHYEGTYDNIR